MTAIPSVDIVMLCVMIACELQPIDQWKARLRGPVAQKVEAERVRQTLLRVNDAEFQQRSVSLFDTHLLGC